MSNRILRWFWGILVLLSCGWLFLGFMATSSAVNDNVTQVESGTTDVTNEDAYLAGTAIGGGLGILFFLCTGLPVTAIAGLLYWRNGVAMQKKKDDIETERRHQEQLAVMQSQIDKAKNG